MKVLMLTDHTSHTAYDSVYALPQAMSSYSDDIDVFATSRAISVNHFLCKTPVVDYCLVDNGFSFENRESYFDKDSMSQCDLSVFDVIFFRIDRPVTDEYLNYCREVAPNAKYVNTPEGLIKTSSKEYLNNFRAICPEFVIAHTLDEVLEFSKDRETVLKPLGGYGGKGLVRISSNDKIYIESNMLSGEAAKNYLINISKQEYPIMAMRYLKRVNEGDKRILVVAGVCLGAVLRVPKKDSWLCNLAQGATSVKASLTEKETEIIKHIDSYLEKEGITVYGIDTLVDDNGERILSEINTTNVGGFVQLEETSGGGILEKAVELIFNRLGED